MNLNSNFHPNSRWQQQSRQSLTNAVLLATNLVEQYLDSLASQETRRTPKLKSRELANKLALIKSKKVSMRSHSKKFQIRDLYNLNLASYNHLQSNSSQRLAFVA